MEKNLMFKKVWESMKDEYFNIHPEAGLAWWDLPLEEQPEEFKAHMYDIFWNLMNNKEE